MGVAAYNRGSKLIRQQIADESMEQITVSKQYITGLESRLSINTELLANQAEEIKTLRQQLDRANMFVQLRAAERNCANDELKAERDRVQYWKDLYKSVDRKWRKCSAILNLIKLCVGRERFDYWHSEAKHDHPELWAD